MKKVLSIFALALLLMISVTSCSKCYECSYTVGIDTDNDGNPDQTDTITDDFCTASQEELNEKEASGETCVAS